MKIFFLGNSYSGAAGDQMNLVPAFLHSRGWKVTPAAYYRAGEDLVGFWERNAGYELLPGDRAMLARMTTDAEREAHRAAVKRARGQTIGELDRALKANKWDVFVLQSSLDTAQPQRFEFQKYARLLAGTMRQNNPRARVVLYMIWSSQNDPKGQQVMSDSCYEAARANGLVLAPVGEAFWKVHAERPGIILHRTPQDSHPSTAGGYLIAMSLYAAVTGESPVGLPNTVMIPVSYDFPIAVNVQHRKEKTQALNRKQPVEFAVDKDQAAFLQQTAWKTFVAARAKLAAGGLRGQD